LRLAAALFAVALVLSVVPAAFAAEDNRQVVVYTAIDQVDAGRILGAFEKETGIKVLPLYDTEAQKTTGLALRLAAEVSRPQADVFLNNELSRTLMLAGKGVLAPYVSPSASDIPAKWKAADGMWAAMFLRARVIVANTDLVSEADSPRALEDLASAKWKGKVAIANPLFGTTACQAAAQAHIGGEEKALDYFRRLKANGVRVYDGNSVVRDVVAAGEVPVGLTDTDDALLGIARGMKLRMILPDQAEGGMGTLVIPNSVAMVKGAPHPEEAKALIDYLLSKAVEDRFTDPKAGYIGVRVSTQRLGGVPELADIKPMKVDWQAVGDLTAPFSRRVADLLLE
jgi:iron(III) transport system substrate-binding protein